MGSDGRELFRRHPCNGCWLAAAKITGLVPAQQDGNHRAGLIFFSLSLSLFHGALNDYKGISLCLKTGAIFICFEQNSSAADWVQSVSFIIITIICLINGTIRARGFLSFSLVYDRNPGCWPSQMAAFYGQRMFSCLIESFHKFYAMADLHQKWQGPQSASLVLWAFVHLWWLLLSLLHKTQSAKTKIRTDVN